MRYPLGILAIFVAAYLPLAINELTTGFSEVRAATDYLASGRSETEAAIPVRFGIIVLRVVSWPLTGLITDGFVAGAAATVGVVAIVAWRWRSTDDSERFVVRWFGLGLLWSVAFLTIAAPSLSTVVRGLPNDHYHAFADPMVFVLVGLGAARIVRQLRAPLGWAVAGAAVIALVAWNVTHLPPAVHPDGGFPAGELAAASGRSGADRGRHRSRQPYRGALAARVQVARGDGLPAGARRTAVCGDASGRHARARFGQSVE